MLGTLYQRERKEFEYGMGGPGTYVCTGEKFMVFTVLLVQKCRIGVCYHLPLPQPLEEKMQLLNIKPAASTSVASLLETGQKEDHVHTRISPRKQHLFFIKL